MISDGRAQAGPQSQTLSKSPAGRKDEPKPRRSRQTSGCMLTHIDRKRSARPSSAVASCRASARDLQVSARMAEDCELLTSTRIRGPLRIAARPLALRMLRPSSAPPTPSRPRPSTSRRPTLERIGTLRLVDVMVAPESEPMLEMPQQLVAGPSTIKLVNCRSDPSSPSSPIASPARSPAVVNGVPVRGRVGERALIARHDAAAARLCCRYPRVVAPFAAPSAPSPPTRHLHRCPRSSLSSAHARSPRSTTMRWRSA